MTDIPHVIERGTGILIRRLQEIREITGVSRDTRRLQGTVAETTIRDDTMIAREEAPNDKEAEVGQGLHREDLLVIAQRPLENLRKPIMRDHREAIALPQKEQPELIVKLRGIKEDHLKIKLNVSAYS